jgi:hypothetical protein
MFSWPAAEETCLDLDLDQIEGEQSRIPCAKRLNVAGLNTEGPAFSDWLQVSVFVKASLHWKITDNESHERGEFRFYLKIVQGLDNDNILHCPPL